MFKPAVKEKLKCRLAIEGPSGSGKTYSALLLGRGLVGEHGTIAMIDTEENSGKLYADVTPFDHAPLSAPYTPERYIDLLAQAQKREYDCVIIDSMSHEWTGAGGILEIHDTMPGNSWTNWAKVNPRHDAFLRAILAAKCHIIVTMRSKQAYTQEAGTNGKQQVKKLGMAPQQRDGVEYEFTAVLKMDISHNAEGDKDRTGLFPVGEWFLPSIETGVSLSEWLGSGVEPAVDYSRLSSADWEKQFDSEVTTLKQVDPWKDKHRTAVQKMPMPEVQKLLAYIDQMVATWTEEVVNEEPK